MPDARTDADLVLASRDDDVRGKTALFRRHVDRVSGVVYRLLGSDADLLDLVQDTFERMYVAGRTDAEDVRRIFVSVPVSGGHNRAHPQLAEDHHSALVFEAALDPATSEFRLTGNAVNRTECLDAHGIAVSPDCSTVATLCRRPHYTSESEPFTRDLVAHFSGAEDIDQPGPVGGEHDERHFTYNDEMWLYEWSGQSLDEEPAGRYVVHKGMGPLTRARGLGRYYLLRHRYERGADQRPQGFLVPDRYEPSQ